MFYQQCKNIAEYKAQFQKIISDIHTHNLIMNKAIILQFFKELEFFFKTYLTILNKKIQSNNKLLTFKTLLKNLKNEESKMTPNDKMINYVKNNNQNQKFSNSNLENSKEKLNNSETANSEDKNFCYRCDKSDHNANHCKYKKAKCYNCDKIEHFRNSWRKKKKSKENPRMKKTMIRKIKVELYVI